MAETVIDRKSNDNCKSDLEEVCKEVVNQNDLGNLLKSYEIDDRTIKLKFE